MAYEDIVQQYYVGFYGRPADPEGLEYWSGQLGAAGGDETAILDYFSNSQEYEDFVLLDESGQPRDNAKLVNFIYNNLFGRDAEPVGLKFWVDHLDADNITLMEIVAQVIDGAQGTDKDAFANKVAVATYFTDNLGNLPYTGADIPDARDILAGVDADPASVDSGEDAVDDWMYETLGLSLTADKADVDEGGVVLFTLASENGTQGDSYTYTISGVDQADVVGGQLTGTVTLDANGGAVIQIGLTEDAKTEGTENLTVTVAEEVATVVVNDTSIDPEPPAYTLTADAADVDEGGTVQFLLQAENVAAGSTYNYTISGVQAEDVVGGQLTGTVTLDADLSAVIEIELVEDATIEGAETLTLAVAGETASVVVNDTSVPPEMTFILTSGQDTFTGDFQDDTFLATQATLQNGDILDGADGDDILTLSVGGSSDFFAAPTLSNIETIVVNSPNNGDQAIELDLSNADGYTTLESYQVTSYFGPQDAFVGFYDIQNVNGTDIRIIDTNVDHEFTYDTNAYKSRFGGNDDIVNLYLSEVDGSTITFGDDRPYAPGAAHVDQVNITSDLRSQVNITAFNYVWDLNVGPVFDTLIIDGNADLEIEKFLDDSVDYVDASALDADLALDLYGQGSWYLLGNTSYLYDPLIVYGAQGDDRIDVSGDTNGRFYLGTGNDMLRVGNASDEGYVREDVEGHLIVDTGSGNDDVILNITGLQNVALGDGNDSLVINGDVDNLLTPVIGDGVTTIDAGAGDDNVEIYGDGDYLIYLGAGDDDLLKVGNSSHTIYAGAGDDEIMLDGGEGPNSNLIYLEDGNDDLEIIGNGTQYIYSGAGNDTVKVNGDGNVTATGDAGDDEITINGDGVHNINLGDGDDYLFINGARLPEANIDNAVEDEVTYIVGGAGDDLVEVVGDHYLNADLGDGNDQLILQAEHLTADDLVNGGEGIDILSLRNTSGQEVTVGASETSSTTSIEVFDLWNSEIILKLTSDNFDTAQDKAITVSTVNSSSNDLPDWNYYGYQLYQGMERWEYEFFKSYNASTNGWDLEDDLVRLGFTIDFFDTNPDGDGIPNAGDGFIYDSVGDTFLNWDGDFNNDKVYFRSEPGVQTIDITDVPMTILSGRSFTLDGGNVRDVVIADDATINGRLYLDYDLDGDTADSIQDTLVVIDGATITAADLRNVDGLEIIELKATSNAAQTWNIELTDRVINQTTGTADLIIRVDPEVAAGSRVNITLDDTVVDALNDVIIEKVGNVDIYIDKGDGNGLELVTESDYGNTDYNDGIYTITVEPRLLFSTGSDILIGTSDSDLFLAQSADQIQGADFADGRGDFDTARFMFAVSNPLATLQDQFEGAGFRNIERFEFVTGNAVRMDGFGFGYVPDLEELATGSGNDELNNMRGGLRYELGGGNDYVDLVYTADWTTVDGGLGEDSVYGAVGLSDSVRIQGVEFVDLYGELAGDKVELLAANPDRVEIYNAETIWGSTGDDNVYADNDGKTIWIDMKGGNDTLEVGSNTPKAVTAYGGTGADSITVYATESAIIYGDANIATVSGQGDDIIDVRLANGNASVYGEGGSDYIKVYSPYDGTWSSTYTESVLVDGGTGDDTLDVRVYSDNVGDQDSYLTVNGGDGNDSIHVEAAANYYSGSMIATVDAGSGDDNVDVLWAGDSDLSDPNPQDSLYVNLGQGDDSAVVTVKYNTPGGPLTIEGGQGNDSIKLINDSNAGGSFTYTVLAGTGDDTVEVISTNDWNVFNGEITGGAGNDTILLGGNLVGEDTLFFGDLTYTALQVVDVDTQGLDTISGFVFESVGGDPAPTPEDIMDFTAFLGDSIALENVITVTLTYTGGDVAANVAAGNAIVVLQTGNEVPLTANDFSTGFTGQTIQLNDNSQAVIVVGTDGSVPGADGISNFDIYYVQDVDSGIDQTWKVVKVADVQAATAVGIESVWDNLMGGLTVEIQGTDGDDTLVGTEFNDAIYGLLGNDTIDGGDGDDLIDGGAGADDMAGGAGADTFVWGAGLGVGRTAYIDPDANTNYTAGDSFVFTNGIDIIRDFNPAEDLLDGTFAGSFDSVYGTGMSSATSNAYLTGTYDEVTNTFTLSAENAGPDIMISTDPGSVNLQFGNIDETVLLLGVNVADMSGDNFI